MCGSCVGRRRRLGVHLRKVGIESLAPEIPVRTSEDATPGWTLDQLMAAYPGLDPAMPHPGRSHAPVPGKPDAVYRMGMDADRLATIYLQLADQSCYE
jgi:hypothetical protein